MKRLIALILCVLLTAAMLVSCGAPKDLKERYLKGEWVAEFGLDDFSDDDTFGYDKVESKIKLILEFDGEGKVKMSVDEDSLDKYFEELIDSLGSEAAIAETILNNMKDELKDTLDTEESYELGENVVEINDTEYKYKEGTLVTEDPDLTFVKQ